VSGAKNKAALSDAVKATKGGPRKLVNPTSRQFPGKIIALASRPRFAVGDLVEFCKGAQPGNIGKAGVIVSIDGDIAMVESVRYLLDVINLETGIIAPSSAARAPISIGDLYRLDNGTKPRALRGDL
jgi:hypothetical protein